MPPPKRPLTTIEVEAIKPHLPKEMQGIFDYVSVIIASCWTCEHRQTDMLCTVHNRHIPSGKAHELYDCYEVKEDDPF